MLNKPQKTMFHLVLESLSRRGEFSNEDQTTLKRLSAGYEGELNFYTILKENLHAKPIQIFDLHIQVSGSECQIDALLIFENELIVCEVKNYQGDFIMDNGDWFTLTNQEIRNPLHQLNRTKVLLQQFLQKHNLSSFSVKPFIIFVHPEFHLYQAPLNIPVIFPPQINRFMNQLKNIPSRNNNRHKKLKELLTSYHQLHTPQTISSDYSYASLRKGIICKYCQGRMKEAGRKHTICLQCDVLEEYDQSIKRNIEDFSYLFPDKKITVKAISDWLDHQTSPFRIRTHLSTHLTLINSGRGAHYVFKDIGINK